MTKRKLSLYLLTAAAGCVLSGCMVQDSRLESMDAQESVSSASQSEEQALTRYTASFLDVFDTVTDIVGFAESQEQYTEMSESWKEFLLGYHELFDIYHAYDGITNLHDINEQAGEGPVEVSDEILDLLEFGKEVYAKTDGQVNIAMGSVLSIWHEYREAGLNDPADAELPPMEALEEAALHTNIEDLVIDRKNGTVYFQDPDLQLDVGGIAKGYAVQLLTDYAKSQGAENLLISVGGNISAVGTKMDGSQWILGIQNPDMDAEQEYVQRVCVQDQCVVTSGDYQRYYLVEGESYCHIIDPDTLMPADHASSVSIITQDSGWADALSTAVFNMPLEEGKAYVEELEGVEAMWILSDGSIEYSSHFQDYLA